MNPFPLRLACFALAFASLASRPMAATPAAPPAADSPVAVAAAADDDGVPKGTVAFFATTGCPAHWAVANLAAGRLVLAVTDGSKVGVAVGTPLGNGEDRTHQHGLASSVTLKSKSISAGSGCCNKQGALVRTYPVSGDTAAASTNLPFVQLIVCEKP